MWCVEVDTGITALAGIWFLAGNLYGLARLQVQFGVTSGSSATVHIVTENLLACRNRKTAVLSGINLFVDELAARLLDGASAVKIFSPFCLNAI